MLAAADRIRDQHGWDLEPDLLAMFHLPNSAYPDLVHSDLPVDWGVWQDLSAGGPDVRPAVALHHLADAFASPAMRSWLRDWLRQDGRRCIGFAMVFEAWLGAVPPGYRHGDLAQASASDRVEARVVAAVDIDGRLHRAIRVRGAQVPTVTTWAVPPPRIRDTRIATGLTRLMRLARAL
ncbi:hypothetical protein C1I95_23675 [Micromonospora craterilacus]|uniref:Uncharacterized protein n=2 Tax=Micromonospora craterilacus TaxID=1655439 RepID=A0A2W2DNB5_9ACTN|nr:hypothetical protein C1I95_23675 [Micromonospora craterilacus]